MKIFLKVIILAIILFFVLSTYFYQKAIDKPGSQENTSQIFEVVPGENVNTIAKNLFKEKLIFSEYYFRKYVEKQKLGASLQAGTYNLSPILSIKDIVRVFVSGETLNKEKSIKFIEGWSIDDMNKYLIDEKILTSDDFLSITKKNIEAIKIEIGDFSFFNLLPQDKNLEGYLFPDTYRVFNDATAKDIIKKMLNNFDKKLTLEMREEIKNQNRSLYEVMTLASIVEKEVQSENDMKLVAGLFLNRLKNGQALESCATLAYILGINKKQYTLEDTQIESPYNTYRNQGLPPGPICNPGLSAIKAVIYPAISDYNYFLSSLEDGKTIFSKTYDEHLRNKAKYLR